MVKANGSNVMTEDVITSGLYTDSLFNIGYQYFRNNDLIRAVDHFKASLIKKPKNLPSSYLLTLCYIKQGDYNNACNELEWLMHVDGLSSNAVELHGKYCTLDKGNEREKQRNLPRFGNGY